eukprot:5379886-Pleurochrysis_carterae.AAC.1
MRKSTCDQAFTSVRLWAAPWCRRCRGHRAVLSSAAARSRGQTARAPASRQSRARHPEQTRTTDTQMHTQTHVGASTR